MRKTVYPTETDINYRNLTKTGLRKVTQTSDFKICIPDYTQTPDIYLENISGYARKDAYRVGSKVLFRELDEFLGYIGANEPTTYYFIPIVEKFFQSKKNEILIVDRFMAIQDKDYVVYSEEGVMRTTMIRMEAGIIVLQDSKHRYSPEQFQKEILWGVVAGVILI
ncbi:MAG TPA: hypothetical protein VNB90_04780 [Cytophagaceae bacterium]|jgi:hypothetical protein|nr:hypothetical protein [Cytophagaceae bacterium]